MNTSTQPNLGFDDSAENRAVLDQLLENSKLYKQSKDYKELLDFVVRMRHFAPFNAMLLQIQKPGLRFAATQKDWGRRFGRYPKEGARPLLILMPFAPVALVYDELDTEGRDLPKDVSAFFAQGSITAERIRHFLPLLKRKGITVRWIDEGDNSAGSIRCLTQADKRQKVHGAYDLRMNQNHSPSVQFVTLIHELAHLYLGHLGGDSYLGIPERSITGNRNEEIEAESVAYILAQRNQVECRSEAYLNGYVKENEKVDDLDVYSILRAAGHIESLLGLSAKLRDAVE